MVDEPTTLDASGSAPAAPQSRLTVLRGRIARFEQSAPGRFWSQLSTADFMNSSLAFAALAVLSAFPFLAVSSAAVGGDIRRAIAARMGLNAEATKAVDGLIASGNQAIATLTWVSGVVLVLGMVGMAATLQTWYARIFETPPPKGLLRHLVFQVAGVAAFVAYISIQVWMFDQVRPVAGGQALIFLLTFVTTVLFWWWSAFMLLYCQVSLRRLFPTGVATGACITGLGIVSAFVFSGQVTSGERSYGPAGVVIAIITFLVGFGVCLHAGAVFGRLWNDWRDERATQASVADPELQRDE